jgi:carbon storage regulator
MLVIQRKPEEQIRIGENVIVRVLGIVGNSVRLGIDAPRSVPVHREEVYEAIQRENAAAAREASRRVDGLL